MLLLYQACDNGGKNIRFRRTFAVSADGAVKIGPSSHGWLVAAMQPDDEEYVRRKRLYGLARAGALINVLFYGGGSTKSGDPYRYYT